MLSKCVVVCSHVAPQGNSSGAVMRFLSRLSPNASGQYLRKNQSVKGSVITKTLRIINPLEAAEMGSLNRIISQISMIGLCRT